MKSGFLTGKQNRPASKRAAATSLQASDRLAADKSASSTKPVLSNEGSEEPSQQPQQQPQSSSHAPAKASGPALPQASTGGPKAACSSDRDAGPRQPSRPPGGVAPTSEKYPPDSVQYSRLQALWHKVNCPDEATLRVYVAIAAVLEAAAQFAEEHEQPVSRMIGEENPEIAMEIANAMGSASGYDAGRLAKAGRDFDMQTMVSNIARSGMQPIEYLLRGLAGALLPQSVPMSQFEATCGPYINRVALSFPHGTAILLAHIAHTLVWSWTDPANDTLQAYWAIYYDVFGPGFARVLEQHKLCRFKTGPCRSREDAIEDTRTMQAAVAAVQQGIRECMVTASAKGYKLADVLGLKTKKYIRTLHRELLQMLLETILDAANELPRRATAAGDKAKPQTSQEATRAAASSADDARREGSMPPGGRPVSPSASSQEKMALIAEVMEGLPGHRDEMQHDVKRFNSKIQQYLAALKNWDIDLKSDEWSQGQSPERLRLLKQNVREDLGEMIRQKDRTLKLIKRVESMMAGQLDNINYLELAHEVASQRSGSDILLRNVMPDGLIKCGYGNGGSSADGGKAAGLQPEPAGSGKSGASGAAGRRDGTAAAAGADSSSVEGMSSKAQMPQPYSSGREASQMPSQQLDQDAMGDPVPDVGEAAVSTAMTKATAESQGDQSHPAESAAQDLTRQDRNARHCEGASQPDLDSRLAVAKEQLAQAKAAWAGGQEAALDEAPEQSNPEGAVQRAKQARKQAKRARQRARREQGAPACAGSKEGGPEAEKCAAVQQPDGSSAQPDSLEQNAQAASERADEADVGLHQDPCGAKGGAGPEDGDVWSGSISDAAGKTTQDGHAVLTEGPLAANASAAPDSSSNAVSATPYPRAEATHTYVQDANEAGSGWATVQASRQNVGRQAENAAPASSHQATASAAAHLLKPMSLLSASHASGHKGASVGTAACSYVNKSEDDECCVICLDRTKEMMFMPCGHTCTCRARADDVMASASPACPMCRTPIASSFAVKF